MEFRSEMSSKTRSDIISNNDKGKSSDFSENLIPLTVPLTTSYRYVLFAGADGICKGITAESALKDDVTSPIRWGILCWITVFSRMLAFNVDFNRRPDCYVKQGGLHSIILLCKTRQSAV
jgi:hypothetical protein